MKPKEILHFIAFRSVQNDSNVQLQLLQEGFLEGMRVTLLRGARGV
jgi:hypothetical protein